MAKRRTRRLANTGRAWVALSKTLDTPFIQSLEQFDSSIDQLPFRNSPLGRVSKSDLRAFRSHLRFVEIAVNGEAHRRFLLSCYFGDLVTKYGFSDDELGKIAALFGIGTKLFGQLYNYFGDFGPSEEIVCRRRPYFFCGRYIP